MAASKLPKTVWLAVAIFLVLALSLASTSIRLYARSNTKIIFFSKLNFDRAKSLFAGFGRVLEDPDDIDLVLGASSIEGFFDPMDFERHLPKGTKAYNLGFRSIAPRQSRLLIEKLRSEFESHGRKAHTAYVRLETSRLTQRFTSREGSMSADPRFQLATWSGFSLDELVKNPGDTLKLSLAKYLFNETSAFEVTDYIRSMYFSLSPTNRVQYFRIWVDRRFEDPNAWDIQRRGRYGFNRLSSEVEFQESLAQMNTDSVLAYAASYFQRCCDLWSARFDEELVGQFLESLAELRKFSKQVIVFYYPEQRSQELQRPGAAERIDRLMERIQRAGFSVLDLRKNTTWARADYVDIMHLSPQGLNKLYRGLSALRSSGGAGAGP